MERLETDPPLTPTSLFYVRMDDGYGDDGNESEEEYRNNVNYKSSAEYAYREKEDLSILQAVVFIEDAAKHRDIRHKIDKDALRLYRIYHSKPIEVFRTIVICVLHLLAFFEFPSSLTWTSDIRYRGDRITLPCGVTEGIELVCLLLLTVDVCIKIHLVGKVEVLKKKWLVAALVVLTFSLIDWMVTIGMSCTETKRIRRIVRPFFLIANSNLMKKTVKCVQRTLPEVASVLLLLALHLYVFTLLGMLLFPTPRDTDSTTNNSVEVFLTGNGSNSSTMSPISNTTEVPVVQEGNIYFRTISNAFMNLLVLLTTANNPDVMMPAYQHNRFYALYFITFLLIGNYCFMNMFLAVIYNQFRGYFKTSMQASLLRRRVGVRAAYEVLKDRDLYTQVASSPESGVAIETVKLVLDDVTLPKKVKMAISQDLSARQTNQVDSLQNLQFQECFDLIVKESFTRHKPEVRWLSNPILRQIQRVIAHRGYNYFGNVVALFNVVMISVELATQYDKSLNSSKSALNIVNFAFILYYLFEQTLKIAALGWKRYVYERWNIFDGITTVFLVILEIFSIAKYGLPLSKAGEVHDQLTLWNAVRIINILIMVRLFRIIPHIKAMSIVANTLVDLIKNLKAFGGILVVIYYSFAILGIEIFHDVINFTEPNSTVAGSLAYDCGTYQQLEYWANNFDDFAAAIVVLWDVMVVNNWSIFLAAYAKALSQWSYIYFIVWWLVSVIIVLQLFTALIIENFIMKWDRSSRQQQEERNEDLGNNSFTESLHYMSLHEMFRENLEEPSESVIIQEIQNNKFLQLNISQS
ncbi:two pore calcium channel protein 2-like isoform X2 [Mizuhopecten yessoensis]|uniref:Two pore calcium channel protein 2 n=1 Tax=Mizuhopecten yessoensis TaxID=6573 RepID=A0A210Q1X9_MIZYE|nr:two pore calcium channel protein 2-like isoform X2 [Mizuhopecten yessoensis]OWF42763.1 Two pore calcium channel protein 2 [Mizuhopecten yessoensis]